MSSSPTSRWIPLAIGATDDESKKHRDTLEVEIPTANLVTVVQPDEPAPVGDPTEAARRASYQRQVIIDALDMQLPKGKISVLIGSNGCGKSTLLKSFARLLKPQQGGDSQRRGYPAKIHGGGGA